MRPLVILAALLSLLVAKLPAQTNETLNFLKAEIQKAARQRDEAQRRLLEVESDSADKVQTLNRAQLDLEKRLNTTSKELLQLEATAQMSKVAMQRSEQELATKAKQIEDLERQQRETAEKYRELSLRLDEEALQSTLNDSDPQGSRASELEKERNQLKEELLSREAELQSLMASQEQTKAQLDQFQELNSQLSTELKASQRSEALATAKLLALESRLTNLQQELANQYQERSELEQEQERLHGVIADLQLKLDEAMNTRVPQSHMDELTITLEEALSENQRLREELARRENVPNLRKEFENIQKQRNLLQAKEKGLLSKVDKLEKELDTADFALKSTESKNRQLERQLREERQIREKMSREISDLEKILKDAESAGINPEDLEDVALLISSMEREKESFKQESIEAKKNVDRLRLELDNQKSTERVQISQLQDMLGRQMEEITSFQRKIRELEVRSSTLTEVREQKALLVQRQLKSQDDMRTLARHIYQLREQLIESKESQRKATLAIKKNQQLANEVEAVRAEIIKLNRLNSAIQNQDANKDGRIRELRIELETGRARTRALEQEKRELLNQLRVLQENQTIEE